MAGHAITFDGSWSDIYQRYCEGQLEDPYPLFSWLQTHYPVHWSEPLDSWYVCSYADVVKGLLDPRLKSDRAGVTMRKLPLDMQTQLQLLGEHLSHWLGFIDPPRHTEIRKLLARVFTPKLAQNLEDRVRDLSNKMVASLAQPRVDLVADLAHPLPLTVICEILGIPAEDRHRFWQAVLDISDFVGEVGPGAVVAAERAHAGVQELTTYFTALVEERRRRPQDDLVSQLATTITDAIDMTLPEVLGICVFLFSAGHDTTTSLISNAALVLLQQPDKLAQLRANPALIATAVEEFIRFESPIPIIGRVAGEDMELGGQSIKRGDAVVMCVAAANRDPAAFPEPDTILLDRTPNKELAFGWGAHFCLGAPLARSEARFALLALLDRLAVSSLEQISPAWHQRLGFRALRELWIESPVRRHE